MTPVRSKPDVPPLVRGLVAAVLAASLAATLAVPATAAAAPASLHAGAGRQPAVAVSHQVVVTWARAGLGATRDQRLAGLRQASRIRRVGEAAGSRAEFVRPFGRDGTTGIYRLADRLGRRASRTLDAIARIPGVLAVEPDPWVTPDTLPDDEFAAAVWGALGPADGSPYGIDAVGAWAPATGPGVTGAGVTVAVLDTGWLTHEDLAGQSVPGYDFITDLWAANDGNGRDADPSDPGDWVDADDPAARCPATYSSWHGLHVSGTIAALAGNGAYGFGAAPGARIQPVRVMGRCGGSTTDVADAITWASGGVVAGVAQNGTPARVLNLSLGGPSSCPTFLSDAIAGARARGSVVVVAAGNSSVDASQFSPANCAGTFVVAATNADGMRASFSNTGSIVDIAAPGVDIVSTYNTGERLPEASPAGDTAALGDGTSMATPHVSAVAALLLEDYPTAAPVAIEAAIRRGATAFAVDAAAGHCTTTTCGAGIASAPRALASLASAPTVKITAPASPTRGPGLTYSLAFSEAVTGLTAGDISRSGTATNCTVQPPSGSGSTWTIALSGCGDGTVILALHPASVMDPAGNAGPIAAVTASTVVLDRGPEVQLAVPASAVTSGQPAYRITFSEPASGFTGSDLVFGTGAGAVAACTAGEPVAVAGSAMTAFDVVLAGCSDGAVTPSLVAGSVADVAGNPGPLVTTPLPTVTVDTTPPVVSAPAFTLRSRARLSGTAAPVTVHWTGSDPGGAPVARYELAKSTDGGLTWTSVTTTTATTHAAFAPTSGRVSFRVVAIDRAGNASTPADGSSTTVALAQQGRATFRRTWSLQSKPAFSGSSARWSRTYRASATYSFTGRAVSFVTTRAASRGMVRIYVDGSSRGVYDLRGSTAYRWVAWTTSWPTAGRHSVRIVVLATPGRPRVDVDAFVVLR